MDLDWDENVLVSFAKSPKRNIQILLYSIDMMQNFIDKERQSTNIIQKLIDMERRRLTVTEGRRTMRVERDRKKRAVSIFTSKDRAHAQGPTAIHYCLVCEGALALLERPESPLGLGYPGFLVPRSLRSGRQPSRVAKSTLPPCARNDYEYSIIFVYYYTLTQDLEKYVREGRKEDCMRVMRGMRKWQWRGLEEGLRALGILLDGM